MSIDSENSLFKQILPDEIPNLIECSPFNKRRGKLFLFSEEGRTKLASHFFEFENYFIVDSMPLEICKFSRHNRIKICKNEFEAAPSKGFCSSQNSWFYGYKLHGVCSINGVFHSLDITKADYIFRKSRKRIETLFSQLCDQFMIRRNYAKSFQGFKTRPER